MSIWGRLTSAFAPRSEAARARQAVQVVRQQAMQVAAGELRRLGQRQRYATSRFDPDWDVNTGRVADAVPRGTLNRARVRRLLRTNPYAAKVRQTLLNNLVGFGIVGTPVTATKKVGEAWRQWVKRADWMGRLDFYGLQDLAVAAMLSDGECFIVRRFEKSRRGVAPTRIEVLDADMLAPVGQHDGIERDATGKPVKYHFRKSRSALTTVWSGDTVMFSAEDVIHLYRADWPGQMRGLSIFEPVVKRFEDMDEYIDAEVVRKKIEACFAAFITPSEESSAEGMDLGSPTGEASVNDFELELVEPGMIERLRPGDQVTFGDPKPSAAIGEFSRVTLLGATAGAGVPYEHGTGDLSNVNYSSYRAGSLEFQRFCGRIQWLLLVPVMLDRVWDWFLEDAYETGMIGKRFYEIGWTPPAFESIDRGKDAKAIREEIDLGLTSLRKEIGARGENFDEMTAEIAADNATLEKLGLKPVGMNAASRPGAPVASGDDETDDNPAGGKAGPKMQEGGDDAADA